MTSHNLTDKHLSDALENNEFLFFYQPMLSLITGKVDSAEALIRWKNSEGKVIPPGDFIPYAEQSGFITEITKAMIPRFLEDQKKILQADNAIVTSINVSAKDIAQREFAPTLLSLISNSGIDPGLIKIELTESSALSLSAECLLDITDLKSNNIQLAVDDFGTGYATFEKLKNLPFDTLKIDHTITAGAMATEDGLTLLDHSVNLAHQLKLNCVAEGVESEATMRYLMGNGCEHIQGYYISRPLDRSSFIKFINDNHVWNVSQDGAIYKTIIDYIDWIRKVTSTLYIENANLRITPDEHAITPTGKLLIKIIRDINTEYYDALYIKYKKSFEIAQMLISAKSSHDHLMVNKLLPEYFEICGDVCKLLYQAYHDELHSCFLKKSGFRR